MTDFLPGFPMEATSSLIHPIQPQDHRAQIHHGLAGHEKRRCDPVKPPKPAQHDACIMKHGAVLGHAVRFAGYPPGDLLHRQRPRSFRI